MGRYWKAGRTGGEPRRACVRACVLAGTGPRGGAAGPGRPGERGLQLWRRPEGSGSGRRRGPSRGRTRGAARPLGIGGLCFALLQWAAVKRLAQSVCAAAPNFRLFLFWPEPRFPSLLAQPVALRYAPSSRCCPAASRGLPHTQARLEGTGVTRSVIPIIPSRDWGNLQSERGRREVHFEELPDGVHSERIFSSEEQAR